jgi:REP element-mobilizing transposase RayT
LRKGVPTLRSKKAFRLFRNAVLGAKAFGLNVVEFAVLGNHFHLMVEAANNQELEAAMKSLNIRLARSVNLFFRRKGAVIEDRYDLRVLKSPTQVRNALIYIFTNAAKHFRRTQVFDLYNSYAGFRESARRRAPSLRTPGGKMDEPHASPFRRRIFRWTPNGRSSRSSVA